MNANTKNKSGSKVFEKVLGKGGPSNDSYEVSDLRPPRISFERADGSSLAVAYGRITLVRHYKKDIYISLGKHFIHVEGEGLRTLYDALHQEQVVRIKELPPTPTDDFLDTEFDGRMAAETNVSKITWTSELEMQG